MSWNQGGSGGPWGGGQSPWGRGGRGTPPDFEAMLRRSQDRVRRLLPSGWGRGRGVLLVLIAIFVLWLISGFYRVEPNEEGVVLRFGAFNRVATPGLNYHWPAPFESALTPEVTDIKVTDIGFRPGPGAQSQYSRAQAGSEVPEESLMLTGDENIVDINFAVFWRIKDAKDYLFNVRNQDVTVKAAAESAMREVIGHTQIASALTEGRQKIANDTRDLTQQILDSYGSGVEIVDLVLQKSAPPDQVNAAFSDVQSARIDLNTLVNQAEAYRNDVVPRAKGEAARIVQEAEAYRKQVVLQAQGEAARFLSVYQSYKAAEDVTARRLYIETMEDLLKNSNKIILDKAAAASGVVPYLPLPGLRPRESAPQTAPQPAQSGARRSQP